MLAEKQRGHKLKGTFPKEVPIPDLTRPNFGDKDEEIFERQKIQAIINWCAKI